MSNNISGFYYDEQKKFGGFTSVTLHANRKYVGTSSSYGELRWDSFTNEDGGIFEDVSISSDNRYSTTPLLSAILQEDFIVSISNNWSDHDGGDALSDLFNHFKPYAGYLKFGQEKLKQMMEAQSNIKSNNGVVNFLQGTVNTLENFAGIGTNLLNMNLVTQGTRFSYYSGTGVAFGNLGMKTIIFPDTDENGNWLSVKDQINKLYPYILGEYLEMGEGLRESSRSGGVPDENGASKGTSNNSGGSAVVRALIETAELFGWQAPPGGFAADIKNVDNVQQGTLMLMFGGRYKIDNLVIRDTQLTFSKQMSKAPDGTIGPLFCEINLTFQPASRYTDKKLKEFIMESSPRIVAGSVLSKNQSTNVFASRDEQVRRDNLGL